MNQKASNLVAELNQHWVILPVKTEEDIATTLNLYEMFNEYSGHMDDIKRSLQHQKMQSHRYRFFLLKSLSNNGHNSTAGYYAADLQNPKYPSGILFDQIFIHTDYRGGSLGTFLTSHFLWLVAGLYYEAKTTARPAPKRIIVEHFREQATPNPKSLAAIRRTLEGFGFRNLPQKDPTACPKTYLPIDQTILDYHNLPFQA